MRLHILCGFLMVTFVIASLAIDVNEDDDEESLEDLDEETKVLTTRAPIKCSEVKPFCERNGYATCARRACNNRCSHSFARGCRTSCYNNIGKDLVISCAAGITIHDLLTSRNCSTVGDYCTSGSYRVCTSPKCSALCGNNINCWNNCDNKAEERVMKGCRPPPPPRPPAYDSNFRGIFGRKGTWQFCRHTTKCNHDTYQTCAAGYCSDTTGCKGAYNMAKCKEVCGSFVTYIFVLACAAPPTTTMPPMTTTPLPPPTTVDELISSVPCSTAPPRYCKTPEYRECARKECVKVCPHRDYPCRLGCRDRAKTHLARGCEPTSS